MTSRQRNQLKRGSNFGGSRPKFWNCRSIALRLRDIDVHKLLMAVEPGDVSERTPSVGGQGQRLKVKVTSWSVDILLLYLYRTSSAPERLTFAIGPFTVHECMQRVRTLHTAMGLGTKNLRLQNFK